jgi:hypothetical protein
MEPTEIWNRAFETVRREVAVPTVWLAMQAARPLTIDGNYFVAALPAPEEYLASHLQDHQTTTAIEEALRTITGRILAFRLITGDSVADWEAQKSRDTSSSRPAEAPPTFLRPSEIAEPPPAFFRSESSPPPAAPEPAAPAGPTPAAPKPSNRTVSPSWEKLNERLGHGYKSAPYIKYAQGQAQFILTAVKLISDTMDVMMPPPGAPRDDAQERLLTKAIERLGGIVNLDPLFLSLELMRFRESQGKSVDIPL